MVIERLILASTSPFRRGLLAQAGMGFEPASPTCNEYEITAKTPEAQAMRRGEGKASSVATSALGALVLGADQVLGFQGRALDKVENRDQARSRLQALQGQQHQLHSAYALAVGDRILVSRCVTALLKMRPLSGDDIEAYLDTGEWEGSVGCYQFENRGAMLFEPVGVDSTVIVGMPIVHLAKDLRQLGIDLLAKPLGPWALLEK